MDRRQGARDETETDYIGRAIRAIKHFAKQYDVAFWLVAHPTKPQQGVNKIPGLYDISGSANFANKADYGLIIHRDGEMSLLKADDSYSEVSGNGVRCLAAWMVEERGLAPGGAVDVRTDAGVKRLEVLETSGAGWTFRAAMGQPDAIARVTGREAANVKPRPTSSAPSPKLANR